MGHHVERATIIRDDGLPPPALSGATQASVILTKATSESSGWCRVAPFRTYRVAVIQRYKLVAQGVSRRMQIAYDRSSSTKIKALSQHLAKGRKTFYKSLTDLIFGGA